MIRENSAACAAHSLVEAFSVLTRLPLPYRLPASEAIRIVDYTREYSTVVTLTEAEIFDTLRSLGLRNLGGGLAFDALLLACARKVGAQAIYTSNVRHFCLIAPDLASIIFAP